MHDMKGKKCLFLLLFLFIAFSGIIWVYGGHAFGSELLAGVGGQKKIEDPDRYKTFDYSTYGLSGGIADNYQAQAFTKAVGQELDNYIALLRKGNLSPQTQLLIDQANAFKNLLPQFQELWGVVKTSTPLYFAADGTFFTANIQDQWIYNTPALYLGSGSALLCSWSTCFWGLGTLSEGGQLTQNIWNLAKAKVQKAMGGPITSTYAISNPYTAEAKKEMDKEREALLDKFKQVAEKKNELATRKAQLDAKEAELSGRQEALGQTNTELINRKSSLKERQKDLVNDEAKLQQRGSDIANRETVLQKKLAEDPNYANTDEYKAERSNLDGDKTQYEADLTKYKADKTQNDADLARLDGDKAQYEADLAKYQADKAEYDKNMAKFKDDKSKLMSEDAKCNADLGALESQYSAEEMKELKNRITETRANTQYDSKKIDPNDPNTWVFHSTYEQVGQGADKSKTETGIREYQANLREANRTTTQNTQQNVTNKDGETIKTDKKEYYDKKETIKTAAGFTAMDRTYNEFHTINYKLLGESSEKTTVKTDITYDYFFFDEGCTAFCSSPLVLDMDGDSRLEASQGQYNPHPGRFDKTKVASFDFFGNGFPVIMEWIGPNDGLLVIPKKDGSIDGTSLFGVAEGYPDGYSKLSLWDKNKDGRLTGDELTGLYIWQDVNQDAKPDTGEVKTVTELGITQINTSSQKGASLFVKNGKSHIVFDWWPTMYDTKKVKKD